MAQGDSLLAEVPSQAENVPVRRGVGLRGSGAMARRRWAPFVGREQELCTLEEMMATARRGQAQLALIEGEPGIGKSTLLNRAVALTSEDDVVLRASGEEDEALIAYGVVDQLTRSAPRLAGDAAGTPAGPGGNRAGRDPLAVGAELLCLVDRLQRPRGIVAVVLDDLHWVDEPSARALLFMVRRLAADQVLTLASGRPGSFGRLGEGWSRLIAGDHRVTRLRLAGLGVEEVTALGKELGVQGLTPEAVHALMDQTKGNPLYCRALLEEVGSDLLSQGPEALPVPATVTDALAARVGSLAEPTRRLVMAVAVLGRRCPLSTAARLADLDDPLPALDQAVQGGFLVDDRSRGYLEFSHPLAHRAIYDHLGPLRRRQLHRRAAELVPAPGSLAHRAASAVGPDPELATELEGAGRQLAGDGQLARAGALLAQASAASPDPQDRDRRLLDALELYLGAGEVKAAESLLPHLPEGPRPPRAAALTGQLHLMAGRAARAERLLTEAWEGHDPISEAAVGANAAVQLVHCHGVAGRLAEAEAWAERVSTLAPRAEQRRLGCGLAGLIQSLAGRGYNPARWAGIDGPVPEVPVGETDLVALRGGARLLGGDTAGGAADLAAAVARLRAGVPLLYASQALAYMAEAEYRLGAWDDSAVHAEVAVTLARGTGRVWDLGFVHAQAALVPAARGNWPAATSFGAPMAVAAAATARASLAHAQGQPEAVVASVAALRAIGGAEIFGHPDVYPWRSIEADALLDLGRLGEAEAAIDELDAALAHRSATALVSVARLRARLAAAKGHLDLSTAGFEEASTLASAPNSPIPPLEVARLQLQHSRVLRAAGRRAEAVAKVRAARTRLADLGARTYVAACDQELAACGAAVRPETGAEALGLTPAELAVARLVAAGRANREVAAQLFVSVKTVEFHLAHIFTKLGVRSRRALADRLRVDSPPAVT